jgi:hypothetical protein
MPCRITLTVSVVVAEEKQRFKKVKNNYLREIIAQERVNGLAFVN